MSLLATLAGIGLILVALYDIFRTLFLPSGKGLLSKWVSHLVWNAFRSLAGRYPALLGGAGPVGLTMSAIGWTVLLAIGWALIYWPRMPESVLLSSGMNPENNESFFDALYFSVVTAATLGYGDITPEQQWMRFVAPLQAMLGFLLFTAIITWLLSIYPDLARRSAFAREVSLLREAEQTVALDFVGMDVSAVEQLLGNLTTELVAIRGDIIQFPTTYYFHESSEQSSLPAILPYVLQLAQRGAQPACPPEVRLQAVRLQGALEDTATTLAQRFLDIPAQPAEQVFAAYARDHMQPA